MDPTGGTGAREVAAQVDDAPRRRTVEGRQCVDGRAGAVGRRARGVQGRPGGHVGVYPGAVPPGEPGEPGGGEHRRVHRHQAGRRRRGGRRTDRAEGVGNPDGEVPAARHRGFQPAHRLDHAKVGQDPVEAAPGDRPRGASGLLVVHEAGLVHQEPDEARTDDRQNDHAEHQLDHGEAAWRAGQPGHGVVRAGLPPGRVRRKSTVSGRT